MANVARRRREPSFEIHEDGPSTEDTQMNDEAEDARTLQHQHQQPQLQYRTSRQPTPRYQEEEEEEEELVEEEEEDDGVDNQQTEQEEDDFGELSEEEPIDESVKYDMAKLEKAFPDFRDKYRLIKRIGEGTFSTVYKAQDLKYDKFDNWWDPDKENEKWNEPPMKRTESYGAGGGRSSSATLEAQSLSHGNIHHYRHADPRQRRKRKYVAVKKIYATSSPMRILNEVELLHDLRSSPSVCPLITAFRSHDQVVLVLPYFPHADFRDYFRDMTVTDMSIYLRSLFVAMEAVHAHGILHRDIKPTNFLYDPSTRRGVLVDFGLAEREGADVGSRRCLCHEDHSVRRSKLTRAVAAAGNQGPPTGYPKEDRRPSKRANRAGTRGFRAPEVLFKCSEQTPKIDVWSAGVILLTILSKRFPFFNSADDVDAMIEISTIFGHKRMKAAAQLHGSMLETSIPTIGEKGFTFDKIIMWSTCRGKDQPLTEEELGAVHFLEQCMELDPSRRISAAEALQTDFLKYPYGRDAGEGEWAGEGEEGDDEVDMVSV